MKEKFLIRMMTWEEGKKYPTMIKAFHSEKITELLNLYLAAKSNDIPISIPVEENGKSKFDGHEAYVDEIRIAFGGQEAITCLNIYVEVI